MHSSWRRQRAHRGARTLRAFVNGSYQVVEVVRVAARARLGSSGHGTSALHGTTARVPVIVVDQQRAYRHSRTGPGRARCTGEAA